MDGVPPFFARLQVTLIEPSAALAGGRSLPAGAEPHETHETHALPSPSAVHFSQKGCCRTAEQRVRQRDGEQATRESVRAQLGALATEYHRLQPSDDETDLDTLKPAGVAGATAQPHGLADPTDHPMMWGECSGICDGDGGDYC